MPNHHLSDVEVDGALLEIMHDALQVTLLLHEMSRLPIAPGEEELSGAFRRSRLMQLRRLIERSIDLVDALDGDVDLEISDRLEDDDPAEDEEVSWQDID